MNRSFLFLFTFSLLVVACSSSKTTVLKEVDTIETHYRIYKLNSWQLEEDTLRIDVNYGGGAIDPHEFELVRKRTDDASVAELWLLHLTLHDPAEAWLNTKLSFDIRHLLRDKNIKKITLNEEEKPVKEVLE